MNHSERQLETARDHIHDLRLEASLSRELQLLKLRFNLRQRLASALRSLAASLEADATQPATSS